MRLRPRFSGRFALSLAAAVVSLLFLFIYLQGKKDALLGDFQDLLEAGVKGVFPYTFTAESVSLRPGHCGPTSLRLELFGARLEEIDFGNSQPKRFEFLPAKIEIEKVRLDYRLSDLLRRKFSCWRQVRIEGGNLFYRGNRPLLSDICGEFLPESAGWVWRNFRARWGGIDFYSEGEAAFQDERFQIELILEPYRGFPVGKILLTKGGWLPIPTEHLGSPGRVKLALAGEVAPQEGEWKLQGEMNAGKRILRLEAGSEAGEKKWWLRLKPEEKSQQSESEWILLTEFFPGGHFSGVARLNHLEIGGCDILTRIEVRGNFVVSDEESWELKGDLATFNTILNYYPFRDIRAEYQFSREGFKMPVLEFGKEYRLSGCLDWSTAPTVDLLIYIRNADLGDLAVITGGNRTSVDGRIEGYLKICGPVSAPEIDFRLRSENGRIGSFEYDWARINFGGIWPIIQSVDSAFKRGKGCYFLEGEADLRKLGSSDVLDSLKLAADRRTMVWKGWDISREGSGAELKIGKDVGDEFRVSFKTLMADADGENSENEGEMELAYRLGGRRALKLKLKREEEVVGIEHKIKF